MLLLFLCICSSDISIRFTIQEYDIDESDGPVQPVLYLDGAMGCCSLSVTVKIEDITAKGKYLHTCICMYVQ